MKFYSLDFEDFKPLDAKYTCDGENTSPTFIVGDVPTGAKELVLMCHDPDASRGTDWMHWLVLGISPSVTEISDKNIPKGATCGVNDFGDTTYGGPCPPEGSEPHRYIFSLYALDHKLILENPSRLDVLQAMTGHILALGTWTGTYQRTTAGK